MGKMNVKFSNGSIATKWDSMQGRIQKLGLGATSRVRCSDNFTCSFPCGNPMGFETVTAILQDGRKVTFDG